MGTYELPKREIKFRYFNHGEMEFYSYEDNSMWALHEIVYPERLMQYTGLKDKLGKEVYEGDIIKCSRGCPHIIEFKQYHGGNVIGGMPTFYLSNMLDGYQWTGDEMVIGNIFENPELLETNQPTT